MRYKITHTTTYTYSEPVLVSQNQAMMTPRTGHGQSCRLHRLLVRPVPTSTSWRVDYYGNLVSYFAVNDSHRRLRVSAVSLVRVRPRRLPAPELSPAWETVRDSLPSDLSRRGLDAVQFLSDSPQVRRSAALADYARLSFPPGRPILAAVLDLTARIHAEFAYDPKATTVHTSMEEAFGKRRGVCQDLAHVAIGCLRSLGLATRYVSGYLRTVPPPGRPRRVGADASHAWLAVWGGSAGWIDVDPTNNLLVSDEHVTVAQGRDYADVSPLSGLIVGGGAHTMTVSVNVEPLDSATAP